MGDQVPRVEKIPWQREWLPTPVFLPGAFHGQRTLVGYSLWGHQELDMTVWLTHLRKYLYLGFPGGSDGKESACIVRDLGSIPRSGRSPGEGNGNS